MLYDATMGQKSWTKGKDWFGDEKNACDWAEIECRSDHVIGIKLKGSGLSGHLPGEAFTRLPMLGALALGDNAISGLIPDELADLEQLRLLASAPDLPGSRGLPGSPLLANVWAFRSTP